MVKFHARSGSYKLKLRAAYAHVKTEREFRAMVERSISAWETKSPPVGAKLREKWENGKEFEVLSWFGLITLKIRVG